MSNGNASGHDYGILEACYRIYGTTPTSVGTIVYRGVSRLTGVMLERRVAIETCIPEDAECTCGVKFDMNCARHADVLAYVYGPTH